MVLCLFCVAAVASASFPAWNLTYNAGVDTLNNIIHDFQLQIVPLISQAITDRLSGYGVLRFCRFYNWWKLMYVSMGDGRLEIELVVVIGKENWNRVEHISRNDFCVYAKSLSEEVFSLIQ